ncbi:hypothetical protein AYI68_g6658 [Smittium mucronatum]|uniref:Ubiquitin-like domain-containing protein n=1 Tax=Smittium mucronatum TaxID=133383 RepID=A0A1R0GQG8_9FUNG|nr:hypothetical protein AYI68_g6826 [Smittium mucronatum]OLY79277.1 hypothetical protein AYI68_g6658 [Smittium mucronatum]
MSSSEQGTFLRVKALLDGQENIFKVSVAVDDNTLGELKKKLSELSGVEEDRQRLIFLGRALVSEDSKLSDLGVLQDHTLLMVERPKDSSPSENHSSPDATNSSSNSDHTAPRTATFPFPGGNFFSPSLDPLASSDSVPGVSRSFPHRGISVFMLSDPSSFVRRQYVSSSGRTIPGVSTNPPRTTTSSTRSTIRPRTSAVPSDTNSIPDSQPDVLGTNIGRDLRNNIYPLIRRLYGNENWQSTAQSIENSTDSSVRLEDFFNPSVYDSVSSSFSEISSFLDSQTNSATSNLYHSLNSTSSDVSQPTEPSSRNPVPMDQPVDPNLWAVSRSGRTVLDLADTFSVISQSLRTLGGELIRNSSIGSPAPSLASANVVPPTASEGPISAENVSETPDAGILPPQPSFQSTSPQSSDYDVSVELFNFIRLLPNISRVSSAAVNLLANSLSRYTEISSRNSGFPQTPLDSTVPARSSPSRPRGTFTGVGTNRPVRISYSSRMDRPDAASTTGNAGTPDSTSSANLPNLPRGVQITYSTNFIPVVTQAIPVRTSNARQTGTQTSTQTSTTSWTTTFSSRRSNPTVSVDMTSPPATNPQPLVNSTSSQTQTQIEIEIDSSPTTSTEGGSDLVSAEGDQTTVVPTSGSQSMSSNSSVAQNASHLPSPPISTNPGNLASSNDAPELQNPASVDSGRHISVNSSSPPIAGVGSGVVWGLPGSGVANRLSSIDLLDSISDRLDDLRSSIEARLDRGDFGLRATEAHNNVVPRASSIPLSSTQTMGTGTSSDEIAGASQSAAPQTPIISSEDVPMDISPSSSTIRVPGDAASNKTTNTRPSSPESAFLQQKRSKNS